METGAITGRGGMSRLGGGRLTLHWVARHTQMGHRHIHFVVGSRSRHSETRKFVGHTVTWLAVLSPRVATGLCGAEDGEISGLCL